MTTKELKKKYANTSKEEFNKMDTNEQRIVTNILNGKNEDGTIYRDWTSIIITIILGGLGAAIAKAFMNK